MMTVVFTAVCAVYIAAGVHINGSAVNVITILMLPYALIVPINNLLMVRQGFYAISDETLGMLLLGLTMFFIGSALIDLDMHVEPSETLTGGDGYERKFSGYRLKPMLWYTVLVEALSFVRLAYIIASNGVSYIATEDFSGTMVSGPLGHLLLTIYATVPILFYWWLGHKRQGVYLVVTVGAVVLFFSSMVKYHVIGMLVVLYLFVSFEDHRYFKKGAVILVALVALLFVSNYVVTFFVRGVLSDVDTSYYLNHLWNYIGGSLITDNRIFDDGVRVGVSTFYKLGTFVSGLPNMFLSLFDVEIFPHESLAQVAVGTNGQTGNVVDAIGYLYPSMGGGW